MLVDTGSAPRHLHVHDLPGEVGAGDLLVVNETRVMPARLALFKRTGGAVEVLLLEPTADASWEALVRPGRRVPPGTVLLDGAGEPCLEVGAKLGEGRRVVEPIAPRTIAELRRSDGEVPLPPYIRAPIADPERYQTVYAATESSVAAPTAGLHLTNSLLAELEQSGAGLAKLELAVGLGTFRPMDSETLDGHSMHSERFEVPSKVLEACRDADRVIAIGTTTVRALEAAAASGEESGRTDLFIRPGSQLAVVDALLTNFHMPRSSLLALVAAFVGPRWRDLYAEALGADYRFLSFGDAMFLPAITAES
jgi:S-adenosylmethionine:tRNA ribosyltransferase-isomerase